MDLTQLSVEALKAAWLDCLLRREVEDVNISKIRQELINRQNQPIVVDTAQLVQPVIP